MEIDGSDGNLEDQYEMLEVLGRGAFGEVKRCIEKSTKKVWAAKCLRTVTSKQKEAGKREIDVMRGLNHDCVIRCHQVFHNRREIALILECITGGELFERIVEDENGLTENDCINFMRQICMGVSHIHTKEVIHLDLKPENIMCLDNKGYDIKIIDFGLARKYHRGDSLKILAGTPEFLAPEIVRYEDVGFESDMWAVGVICYVLLSGLSPFLGDTDSETLANVVSGDWDFEDEDFDNVSEEAKSFIRRLLILDKGCRHSADNCLSDPWLTRSFSRSQSVLSTGSATTTETETEIDCAVEQQCTMLPKDKLKRFVARRRWQACADVMSVCRAFVNIIKTQEQEQ